jgi:hypothetical protein
MAAPHSILAHPEPLQLLHLGATATEVIAVVETTAASAACPLCGSWSRRADSRYVRWVADVPR